MNGTETRLTRGTRHGVARVRPEEKRRMRSFGEYSYCPKCGRGWTGEAKARACCKPIRGIAG